MATRRTRASACCGARWPEPRPPIHARPPGGGPGRGTALVAPTGASVGGAAVEASGRMATDLRHPHRPRRRPGPMNRTVMWFRRDLRLSDNPALLAAARDVGGDGEVVAAVLPRPAAARPVGTGSPCVPVGLPRRLRRRRRWPPRRAIGPARVRGPAGGGRDRGDIGVRLRGLRALRPWSRRACGPGAGRSGRRAGPRGLALRRAARRGREGGWRPVQGVHALLAGVAGPRLARAGAGAARRPLGRGGARGGGARPAEGRCPAPGGGRGRGAAGGGALPRRPDRRLRRHP